MKTMSRDLAGADKSTSVAGRSPAPGAIDDWPWCERCGSHVDSFGVEYMTTIDTQGIFDRRVHTGEVVINIQCHGETWKASNWRGRL